MPDEERIRQEWKRMKKSLGYSFRNLGEIRLKLAEKYKVSCQEIKRIIEEGKQSA